jgi:hypothetical protein
MRKWFVLPVRDSGQAALATRNFAVSPVDRRHEVFLKYLKSNANLVVNREELGSIYVEEGEPTFSIM